MSYYLAGLFSKKLKLASKSGSNKRRDLLTGELLTEVYCNEKNAFVPLMTLSVVGSSLTGLLTNSITLFFIRSNNFVASLLLSGDVETVVGGAEDIFGDT